MKCVFCDIVEGKSKCHKIWEDEKHLAFLDIYPNTRGFSIVIPKDHYSSYAFAQNNIILLDLIKATKKVALLLDKSLENVGRTGMILEGYGVDHLHSKLFPMHGTGNSSDFKLIKSKFRKYFNTYEGYISSNSSKRAKSKELNKLANYIRSRIKH